MITNYTIRTCHSSAPKQQQGAHRCASCLRGIRAEAYLLIMLVEEVGGMVSIEAKVHYGPLLEDEHTVEEPEGVGRRAMDSCHDGDAFPHLQVI